MLLHLKASYTTLTLYLKRTGTPTSLISSNNTHIVCWSLVVFWLIATWRRGVNWWKRNTTTSRLCLRWLT